jgi:hypothetical protein
VGLKKLVPISAQNNFVEFLTKEPKKIHILDGCDAWFHWADQGYQETENYWYCNIVRDTTIHDYPPEKCKVSIDGITDLHPPISWATNVENNYATL